MFLLPTRRMKGFTITRAREIPSRDDGNPLASLIFEPSWDSDELYDALKIEYPRISTHKDRFLKAVIDFYDEELGKQQKVSSPNDTVQSLSGPKSPETRNSEPSLVEVVSSASTVDESLQAAKPNTGIKSMLGAFALTVDGSKPRSKRPMTDQERLEYRQIKRIGACESCRKKKRKCRCKISTDLERSVSKKSRVKATNSSISAQLDNFSNSSDETFNTISDITDVRTQVSDESSPSYPIDTPPAIINLEEEEIALESTLPTENAVVHYESQWSTFSSCPDLSLGDLAMPDSESYVDPYLDFSLSPPVVSIDPHESMLTKLREQHEWQKSSSTDSPAESSARLLMRQHPIGAYPLGHSVDDFVNIMALITRTTAALVPLSRFADEAQLLLQELRTLHLQLNLLRKPMTFLAKPMQYYNTVRDVALDLQAPLKKFNDKVYTLCGVDDIEKLPKSFPASVFGSNKLQRVQRFCDDARRLKAVVSATSTTISHMVTLISMDTLSELHALLHSGHVKG